MTKSLYLNDTYLFELNTEIIGKCCDDKGKYVILDQTIFYPQGGGQPSDQGIIKGSNFESRVISVKNIENEIRHYVDGDIFSSNITCLLDRDKRILNARYHTAAHLLSNVVETMYPHLKAVKGHSFPNEAYIELIIDKLDELPDIIKLQNTLYKAINAESKITIFHIEPMLFEEKFYKLPYHIPDNKVFRIMQIGNFSPVPCGGTHVINTKEIGDAQIEKIKRKNDTIRISYKVI